MTIRNGAEGVRGGGLENEGGLTLTRITVSGNIAQQGGGLWNNGGTVTINSSTISGNTAYNPRCKFFCLFQGGGIYNQGALTVNNSTISGNSATSGGSGIFNLGHTATINRSTFSGNSFANWYGTVTISQSTFSGNGAGITVIPGGTASVSNSTMNSIGVGGKVILSNCTVSGSSGTGISVAGTSSKVVLQNSIVANNSGGNCSIRSGGTIASRGHNLSSDATCDFDAASDLNNIDPMLGPLQKNGGPTQTMALPSGSPAIDAGNPHGCRDNLGNLLNTDQRGMPRHDKEDTGGCDMGAYESQRD